MNPFRKQDYAKYGGRISYHKCDGHFWIRIFGFGVSVKDTQKHSLLFSERNGYAKGFCFGKYYFKILTAD